MVVLSVLFHPVLGVCREQEVAVGTMLAFIVVVHHQLLSRSSHRATGLALNRACPGVLSAP